MRIIPAGQRPTARGKASQFTGEVSLDPIITEDVAKLRANIVTFPPGARTFWHHHDYGQTLYVTQGAGLICLRGGTPEEIRAGDTVWIEPGEEHWHGASATNAMTHIAIQASEGGETHWLEEVTG